MSHVGRYKLLRRVGVGGMAEVWKAKAEGPAGFEKYVAIKVGLPDIVEDVEFVDLLVDEAKLVAQFNHPNIVQVVDFGHVDEDELSYFIAMEYVAGQNVATVLREADARDEVLTDDVALLIIYEVAQALGFAHGFEDADGSSRAVIHRDVSPHNILISYHGDTKVADFGIAKIEQGLPRTGAGLRKGKIAYMSPEQAELRPLDVRSDVFSLGLVLYELLTGRRYFRGTTAEEIFQQILQHQGVPADRILDLPREIQPILFRALQANPGDRFANAREMATAIGLALGGDRLMTARTALAEAMTSWFSHALETERRDDDPDWAEQLEDQPEETTRAWGTGTRRLAGEAVAPEEFDPELSVSFQISSRGLVPELKPARARPELLGQDLLELSRSTRHSESQASSEPEPDPPARRRRHVRPGFLVLLAFAAGLLTASSWIRTSPRSPVSAQQGAFPTAVESPAPAAVSVPLERLALTLPAEDAETTERLVALRDPFSAPAEATPAATAAPAKSRRPRKRRIPAVVAAAPTPAPEAADTDGLLTIHARPWVEVWVDGFRVANETPLRRHQLSAGRHQVRFVNPQLGLLVDKVVTIAEDRELALFVDGESGQVRTR